MSSIRREIPRVSQTANSAQARFFDAVKEHLDIYAGRGDALDRVVTFRDLLQSGVFSANQDGSIAGGRIANAFGTNYVDLNADGNQIALKFGNGIEIEADGTATFGGVLTAAGVVTLANLASSPTPRNLIKNGSFELDGLHWSSGLEATNAVAQIITAYPSHGEKNLRLAFSNNSATGSVYYFQELSKANSNDLIAGKKYLLSFNSNDSLVTGSGDSYLIIVRCRNAADTTDTDVALTVNGGSGYAYSGAIHQQKIGFTTPADLGKVRIFIRINATATGRNTEANFDKIQLERIPDSVALASAEPSDYFDAVPSVADVDTMQVRGNAITANVTASTLGSTTINNSLATDIVAVTITAIGGTIVAFVTGALDIRLSSGTPGNAQQVNGQIDLYRGVTFLGSMQVGGNVKRYSDSERGLFAATPLILVDNPGSGSFTYTVKAAAVGSNLSGFASNFRLVVAEFKR